jgi:hypothetical protein
VRDLFEDWRDEEEGAGDSHRWSPIRELTAALKETVEFCTKNAVGLANLQKKYESLEQRLAAVEETREGGCDAR